MKVVIGALELDPTNVAGSAKSVPAEHGPQTDRGRLEKLRRWDERAWTQFFKDYESKIITLCVAMTRDRAIAEDICADTFVRVVSSIDAFRENSAIKTWIYTIARNLCLTHLARAKRTVSLDDEMVDALPDCTPGAEQVVADREADTVLQEAIGQLDPSLREALLLRVTGDLSYAEIAQVTGVPAALLAERRSGNSPNSLLFSGAWPFRMHRRTSPTMPCGWCARERAQRASPDGRTSFQRCSTLNC